jgi:hypothetical protein
MTTVSHFRALKVQQAGQKSLIRSIQVLRRSAPVTSKSILTLTRILISIPAVLKSKPLPQVYLRFA